MRDLLKILLWSIGLAVITAGVGWLGFRWDGETDKSSWYALLALPFLLALVGLPFFKIPWSVAVIVGMLLQIACCLVVVGVAWVIWRAFWGGLRETPDSEDL